MLGLYLFIMFEKYSSTNVMINPKKTVKQLIFFAKREFREKRPFNVRVLRMKSERIFTKGGSLKVLSISQTPSAYYLVLVEYENYLRIYYYSKDGLSLGARNFEVDKNLLQKINKSSVVEYKFPK